MFLEKVREIKKAEDSAAEKKSGVQSNIRQMTAKAHEDGSALVTEAENGANSKAAELLKDAESKAYEILETAKNDAKIDAVAQKVEAEVHIPEAVKYVIQAVFSDFVRKT